ncbi:hypothetical protein HHE02_17790 [Helicobacter heilmannii]|nr:hypothetical protein HHE02_17790 [Helicobacter heilmannii]
MRYPYLTNPHKTFSVNPLFALTRHTFEYIYISKTFATLKLHKQKG